MKISEQVANEIPLGLIIDRDEYESALRTVHAQALAKSLGCKLPYSLAKKFYCRCGKVFVYPKKFLAHRVACAVLIRDKELLDRRPKEPEQIIVKKSKKRITFDCSCGHEFHSKGHLTKHRKLCFTYRDYLERIERGKEYLERHDVVEPKKKRRKRKASGNSKKTKERKASKRSRV